MTQPAPPDRRTVTEDLPRARTRRDRRLRTAARTGVAVIAVFCVAFAYDHVTRPQGPYGADPQRICVSDENTVRADIDGDGRTDTVDGAWGRGRYTVRFADGDTAVPKDALSRWQRTKDVLHSGLQVRAVFGDWDGDHRLDMALFRSQPDDGDMPNDALAVHEVHYGPLSHDLTSDRTGPVRMSSQSFVEGGTATRADAAGKQRLRLEQSAGDGATGLHPGTQDRGGITVDQGGTSPWNPAPTWQRTARTDFTRC
ncbi:hypothetical protein GTW43_26450 [Streptomyces sp. SID5785]|uniref:hypothetical protein n=1 Tax=Streptomyces sp. SID5785 TaxID=2690309 RepID=UPI0013615CF7|nr:hypothetical protein [Streptomyces sp. SID5785]MZD07969.1 hypothetical protein [Streptomyces sp. SID5785]MZD08594.1 hypothetical protein [Streptomyces sp. SID5785]